MGLKCLYIQPATLINYISNINKKYLVLLTVRQFSQPIKQLIKMAQVFTLATIARNGDAYAFSVGIPTAKVIAIRPANSNEVLSYPTAVTAVDYEDITYNSIKKSTYLSITATATVITAASA